jgi:hypothetical protein
MRAIFIYFFPAQQSGSCEKCELFAGAIKARVAAVQGYLMIPYRFAALCHFHSNL